MKPKSNPLVSRPLAYTAALCALAAFTIAGQASATTLLFLDNFNTASLGNGNFNNDIATDQSGTAATKTYTTVLGGGWDGAYQRGNGGTWLMYAGTDGYGSSSMQGSLNYDIAAAANTLSSALQISFNMSVSNPNGDSWSSFSIGNQNPFVTAGTVGFGSIFRDSGATTQFSNGGAVGGSATFTDGQMITFVLSDFDGSGSAFNSDGETDVVKMYVGNTLTNTFTGLNLDAADQFISFHANNVVANLDNLSITAIPEPSAALLGGLGLLALLRRRRA